jgi:tRNA threonylcarbamoyl adenosine modification protein (Sua5/YciO/YrdC/YwlC family)
VDVDGAVERAVAGLEAGQPVLLPTDTVYGLCAAADREAPARALYRLKGRSETQPSALLTWSLDSLFDALPELRGEAGAVVRALLPGPYTLVVPNPSRRYRWLNGTRTDAIGVRVPVLPEPTRRVIERAGCVIATSANDPGGPNPVSLEDVPRRIRDGCAAELDLGPLPGTPSTVIDFTGPDPYVIREGAVSAAEALERVRVYRAQ